MKPNFYQTALSPRVVQNNKHLINQHKRRHSLMQNAYNPIRISYEKKPMLPMTKQLDLEEQTFDQHLQTEPIYEISMMNKDEQYIEEYQKLTSHYQNQNINLRDQNSFLLERIRIQKKKENSMKEYIQKLQSKIAHLEGREPRQSLTPNYTSIKSPQSQMKDLFLCSPRLPKTSKELFNHKRSSTEEQFSRLLNHDQNGPKNLIHVKNGSQELQEINEQFHQLIEQCVGEKDETKKSNIRKELADLAKKMKTIRLSHNLFQM